MSDYLNIEPKYLQAECGGAGPERNISLKKKKVFPRPPEINHLGHDLSKR